MTGYLNILLRLAIWFLLTADFGIANTIIGVCVALLLPRRANPGALKDWLHAIGEIIIAIPQAFIEAIEIMVRPHRYEAMTMEHVKPQRTPGLIFLDIFVITFTPKTIVLKYHEEGLYEVHRIQRRKQS
ncbi:MULTISPECIES: Na+/H+ antiporter subunit E [Acaryochloris]|uniref:Cation:proton antiporter n=1 Tax=Acaryochloris marina (strain MBIC 11017) TaxID=329726 RepID=B0CFP2_ACAM1|nr:MULTISPECIES: Na+/H+ antiporter subunit E [Acaryochloris]ABW28196.1 conserved hypothetical protein [Acaryochloris marina MBIC11017]BDM77235.1 cation:proton antiporter [Acaryochloris marina MBIC10699]